MLSKNQIKTLIKTSPVLLHLVLKLYQLNPAKFIPQSKYKLEKDATNFWNKPKAGDFQYEKALSHYCGARLWDRKKFIEYGNRHFNMYLKALFFSKWTGKYPDAKNFDKSKLNIYVVEWGPGGGG